MEEKKLHAWEKKLPDPAAESLNEYEKLRKKFNDYFTPKRNKHHARYIFLKMKTIPGETTVTYAIRLKENAQDCEFGDSSQSDEKILKHLIQTIENELLIQKCFPKDGTYHSFSQKRAKLKTFLCKCVI